MDAAAEQVQAEAFQPGAQSSKLGASEGPGSAAAPRTEDGRGAAAPPGLAPPSLEPVGSFPRPPCEDGPPEQTEEQGEDEGAYDCTLS